MTVSRRPGVRPILRAPWLVGLLLLQACSNGVESPEDQVRRTIARAVEAAENRSVDGLAGLLHPDYRDRQGYDRERLSALLRAYFLGHRNIHLFTRIGVIEFAAENEARVEMHVAMAASVIADIDALASLRARLYRFELHFERDGSWLLRQAAWAPAKLSDLE